MNSLNLFDADNDWTLDPYHCNSSNDPLVDKVIGNAYAVVRTVYCNLGNLKLLYDFLNTYGMVLGVKSEDELKKLNRSAKYARIYGFANTGDHQVTDYLYVPDDTSGIRPDDPTATGSWIKIASSTAGGEGSGGHGSYIPYVYAKGSAVGNETSFKVPEGTLGVPFIIINGSVQYIGYGFEYDVATSTVTLSNPLAQGDEVVALTTAVPANPDNPYVSDWVQVNWLYNNGYALGGEQVITVPYNFKDVPAVYKNGLRLYKGLQSNSYVIDPDTHTVTMTEILAQGDRVIVTLGGESETIAIVDRTIQEVARANDVKDDDVVLSTNTNVVITGKKIIYDVNAQKSWALPDLPPNAYIVSVVGDQLTYNPGNVTVTLLSPYQQINTRELWKGSLAEAGLTLVDGSFEEGATVASAGDAVWHIGGGKCYTWDGSLPYTVPAESTPASSGGFGAGKWLVATDIGARKWAEMNLQPMAIYKEHGSFETGGKATSKVSALFSSATGMYYTPKAGTLTVAAGSSPNSSWVCLGIMGRFKLDDVRNFKAVGDGVADDTTPLFNACLYAAFFNTGVFIDRSLTVISGPLKFSYVDGMRIYGQGTIKMKGDRTGEILYAGGAQITFIGSSGVDIDGLIFDGNRKGSPEYTGFNHGVQFVPADNDFRSNNGGASKPSKRNRIRNCIFKNQGSNRVGQDKFGDGVYLFGCDDVEIVNVHFENVGRWGVAMSDCLNVKMDKLTCDNTAPDSVALGFIDIENESIDNTNGTYSENISMSNLSGVGLCQIRVGGGSNSENKNGAAHYLRNITGSNINLKLIDGPTYPSNYFGIGVIPFCNEDAVPTVGVVENSNITFDLCKVTAQTPGTKIGFALMPEGVGGNNIVSDIVFTNCISKGAHKAFQGAAEIKSGGYTMRNITVTGIYDAAGANSIGVRMAATQLVNYRISVSSKGSTMRALSLEDGRAIGAVDSYGKVFDTSLNAASGVNAFAYIYRASFTDVECFGSAPIADLTVNVIDKDYGNTWNSMKRTVPGFTVAAGAQQASGGIDIGSHTRFGYTVNAAAPFIMDQAAWHANVTEPGFAILLIKNNTDAEITKAADEWTFTVEKR